MTTVRTRIAPSPTGDPHVGTAYIALFNYCFAKQHGGEFILRIEDTDQLRSTRESEQQIFDALRWLGIDWSEGPDVGGPHGPYRQSERGDIYQKYCQQLVDMGHAFPCFCTAEELDQMRAEQMARGETPRYDGRALLLSKEEVAARLAAGEPHVIRMKVPSEGVCVVPDMLRGDVEIPWDRMDMQVLMKTDGLPTYFLANVVDDHLMGITHVLRGEEWLPSAPKLILLYEYFGWEQPELCYMPLLRNPDKSKLSKRKNPTSVTFYERMGFMPEAMLNYLGRMGWSMPDEREKFSLQEMVDNFDLKRVSLGGPIFDIEKLSWLNGQWLRDLPVEEFAARVQKWAFNSEYMMKIAPHVQGRVETFSQVAPLGGFFFAGGVNPDAKLFESKKLSGDQVRQLMQLILWKLESLRQWEKDNITATIQAVVESLELKLRDAMPLMFAAITGQASSVSVLDAMEILGPDLTRFRLRQAIDLLGGVSKKENKEWEKLLGAIA
ncbi:MULTISPECIES: glutamate--tRNA ligase [Pseudomonas]|uniref:Glutamate--tRNA ligase n=1 Tax=Pseudomonas baetica TaxID=674054 RepID=A0ABX4PUX1_9PSED|nr:MULTISPECIES: glutamate--tRNA ligase [Pseudomonas]MDR9862618.1 glutamate--tRNA ligase [Pseudomonas baetica]PKA68033.1 glutamyl-tRNA synthetase [Pseudomonas baetica]PTC18088.1 glutamate--tRNA ligase [Pseudomonas baetica]